MGPNWAPSIVCSDWPADETIWLRSARAEKTPAPSLREAQFSQRARPSIGRFEDCKEWAQIGCQTSSATRQTRATKPTQTPAQLRPLILARSMAATGAQRVELRPPPFCPTGAHQPALADGPRKSHSALSLPRDCLWRQSVFRAVCSAVHGRSSCVGRPHVTEANLIIKCQCVNVRPAHCGPLFGHCLHAERSVRPLRLHTVCGPRCCSAVCAVLANVQPSQSSGCDRQQIGSPKDWAL